MPIYEYRCRACRRRFTKFFRSFAAIADPENCPYCGTAAVERLLSRVVVRRGATPGEPSLEDWERQPDDVTEDTGAWEDEPDLPDVPESDDPREFARWARDMAAQVGEPLDPAFERALRDLERGEDPDRVLDRLEEESGELAAATDDAGDSESDD